MVVPPSIVVDNTSDATSAPCGGRRREVGSRLVPGDDSASYSGRRPRARRSLGAGGSEGEPRITAVRFTLRNLRADLEDVGANFDGAPDLEFRLASKALELEQSGLSYQRIPPGYRFPYGHTHKDQEEVYVIVRGSGRMKLDDEIVDVKEWDVVRVPPGMWRGYEGGPEGLEMLVFGAPNLGEDPRGDVEGQRDWWAD
jgi:mannose-6-phosphate isomerase-like protein (cupin superfamily)